MQNPLSVKTRRQQVADSLRHMLDVLHIPSQARHQFVNTGNEDLCLLMAVPKSEQVTLATMAGN